MSASEMYDLVIVGGGPGGLSAGIYAIRAALKTVLVEKGITGGQINLTESVENYPGFENISGFELSQKFLEHAKSYGLEMIQHEVAAVEPGLKFHTVRLANGELLNSHAVILATGGSPRNLGVPGELEYYGKGVSYCATCDGFFFRGKDVIVGRRRRYRFGRGPLSRQNHPAGLPGPPPGRLQGQPDFAAAGPGRSEDRRPLEYRRHRSESQ